MNSKIGFMQGRLSPLYDNKIQAFPWNHWQQEFEIANSINFNLMEWTLDYEGLYDNPLMNADGQKYILELSKKYGVKIKSLTGDCFMQKPFYKPENILEKESLLDDLKNIIKSCGKLGIELIVFPLVDNGALDNLDQEELLIKELLNLTKLLEKNKVKISFETDYTPNKVLTFIKKLPKEYFGINYDIGNSAALGYSPKEEIELYGDWITNVHIKDRILGGTTVPLGEGAADFSTVFKLLINLNYSGNYILQTARSSNNQHAEALCKYREFVKQWI